MIVAVTGAPVLLMAVKAGTVPVPDAARPILMLLLLQLYTVPGIVPVMVTAVEVAPLHSTWLATAFTVGVGLTVMVKVNGTPTQVVSVLLGVTVTVAVTGTVPVLVAMKLGISPTPDAARPIEGWLFVHWKNTPGIAVVNVIGAVADPLHSTWLPGGGPSSLGVGLTVITKVLGVPVQVTPPFVKVGVTVMVPDIGKAPGLVDTKLILPVPAAARPIAGLLFVQLYTVPVTAPVKFTVTVAPAHTVWSAGWLTVGVGFTVMVNVTGLPVQLTPPLV